MKRRLLVLIGPKGSGKSYIGTLIEARLGVPFFRVEPIFMEIRGDRSPDDPDYIREGFEAAEREIRRMIAEHGEIVIESTGTTPVFWEMLSRLSAHIPTYPIRIEAPYDLCRERMASRDQRLQIPVPEEMIRRMYTLSDTADYTPAGTILNDGIGDEDILDVVGKVRSDAEQGV